MSDPAYPRKLLTAFVTLLVIVGFTYFASSYFRSQAQPVADATPAAPVSVPPSGAAPVEAPRPAEPDTGNTAESLPAKEELLKVRANDVSWGSASAPVTIIEYASLSCSHCARFHQEVLPKLEEKYIATGKVRLVHRFFPLNEPALRASQLVACSEPDKAKAFLNVLFKTQEQWAFDISFRESLVRIAGVGGMSREAFDACLANKEIETGVLSSRKEGQAGLGVESTPTFFINGNKFQGEQSIEQFSAAIDPLLK